MRLALARLGPAPDSVLRLAELRWLLVARGAHAVGSSALLTVLGYQVYQITGDPLMLGILGLVAGLPALALGLFGGHLADRRDRRIIVFTTSTCLALLPYLLAAAYALKLGLTGETYDGVAAAVRRKETIVAGVATAYTIFLFDAAGMKFVLLMTVILAPASLLYIKARSEHGRRLFTPAEIALFALIVAGGVIGAIGLWTGRIVL